MSIVGDHPESGVRFVLERPYEGGPPWTYAGHAFTPDARFALTATVEADGAVAVSGEAPADVAEKARLVLRALYKKRGRSTATARRPARSCAGAKTRARARATSRVASARRAE